MKHITEGITWEDALLELEQVKDGKRPPADTPTLANPLYMRAYNKFLHHGTMTNTLREGSDSEGGYLVPDSFEHRVVQAMKEKNVMRRLGTVILTERTLKIPVAKGLGPADWVPEEGVIPVTEGEFDEIRIEAYKVATTIRVSDELLEDCGFDLEDFIISQFADRIARAEEQAFLYGDGKAKPLGLIHQLEREVITEEAGKISTDDLLELIHAIPPKYRDGAVLLMHDSTLRELYKLQTANGSSIWNENLKKGQPLTILGHRVITSPAMPMIESGKVPIFFGNFSFYTIGDRQHRRVKRLNEVYAQQGQVAYIMSQRVDAKLLDKNAVAALKMK